MIYCIDTSSLIDAGERYYPQDVFPAFWKKLELLVDNGRLQAPPTLLEELTKKDDKWREWVYEREDKIIVPFDGSIFETVKQVVEVYKNQSINQFNPDKLTGDPFFIALSKTKNMTLITSEQCRMGGFKIPSICKPLGVQTTSLLNMIRNEGWSF